MNTPVDWELNAKWGSEATKAELHSANVYILGKNSGPDAEEIE